jgi:hypothetical protein
MRLRKPVMRYKLREMQGLLKNLAEDHEDFEYGYVSRCLEDAAESLQLAIDRLARDASTGAAKEPA